MSHLNKEDYPPLVKKDFSLSQAEFQNIINSHGIDIDFVNEQIDKKMADKNSNSTGEAFEWTQEDIKYAEAALKTINTASQPQPNERVLKFAYDVRDLADKLIQDIILNPNKTSLIREFLDNLEIMARPI